MKNISRRKMLATSGGLLGAAMAGNALFGQNTRETEKILKVMVTGAHPDDPESGCGGTMLELKKKGHDVVALYLTRGEAGIGGMSHAEAAAIRTAEAEEACKVLGARPLFAGQIDGSTVINKKAYQTIADIIEAESPDIVFNHWPIDTHPDHRISSNLVYNAWNWFRWDDNKAFDMYYYEVLTGSQTQNFSPAHYIDITASRALKKEASMKHVSQDVPHWYNHHEDMSKFRGLELKGGKAFAEAFVRQGYAGV